MKIILSSRRRHYIKRVGIFSIMVALIAGMIGCARAPAQYTLFIFSTEGGSVTTPGQGRFTYDEGTVVNLVAQPDEGYQFMKWTGSIGATADVYAAETTITINGDYTITASFAKGIWDWYDLDAIRDNLNGDYLLMNDLDSTTAGYEELASATANQGKGWEPIGTAVVVAQFDPWGAHILLDPFAGTFDGQGYEIRDLFINRPHEEGVGLFGSVDVAGVTENVGVVNGNVTGRAGVGSLVGINQGTLSNSYSSGSVTGDSWYVGGLVGINQGTVSDSHSTGSVTGSVSVAGLAGCNSGTVSDCYSTSSVTGDYHVAGLVGDNDAATVSDSYSTGSVSGKGEVGGLVAENIWGTVSNSYYNYNEVVINGQNIITIGALFAKDFEQWLANDKFLDVNERLPQENGYYLINDVNDFKQLLAFGQDDSLKFRLKNDLDLATEPDFRIPYLAGEFDGNGHKISNLSFNFDFVAYVGLFGYLAPGGKVTQVGVENANITGSWSVGGMVGWNDGIVSNSYSTGKVTGYGNVGGLVGTIHVGAVMSNSYSTASMTGSVSVGGLVGAHRGTVSNSYYSYDEVMINGKNIITIGALSSEEFQQWLVNDKFLDVNERLSQENGHYLINDVNDFKQLLAFGQDNSLKFRLKNDLDLGDEPNFYIPYLAGEFDGNGHKISNLSFNFDFVSSVGLFGYLASGGKVTEVGAGGVKITGCWNVGGLVGWNSGTVNNSYSAGSVTGAWWIGGLVGSSNNYSTVSNSYSTSSVTGGSWVGGLVGINQGTVSNSFWDIETSGQTTSAGGTGKTTAEMQDITTFSGASWNIIAVADLGTRNLSYIWNIVNEATYPFLSWQRVS
jgi:hypothetical protein